MVVAMSKQPDGLTRFDMVWLAIMFLIVIFGMNGMENRIDARLDAIGQTCGIEEVQP